MLFGAQGVRQQQRLGGVRAPQRVDDLQGDLEVAERGGKGQDGGQQDLREEAGRVFKGCPQL